MTQVDFYFNAHELFTVTHKLLIKALANHTTIVITVDEPQLQGLDEHLWSFHALHFIPHVRANSQQVQFTPVILALPEEEIPSSHYGLMINLASKPPKFFSRFTRVLELVSTADDNKQAGRERFKFYKQRGYPMSHVDLAKK